jgi:hypothetical protein
MEDILGVHIHQVTEKVLIKNIKAEIDGVKPNADGYTRVKVSGDGAWQTGGRRSYNSLSGQTMLIGKRTDLVLA